MLSWLILKNCIIFKPDNLKILTDENIDHYLMDNSNLQTITLWACSNNHISVLNLLHKYRVFQYDENAVNCALSNGHIETLDWLKHNGHKLRDYDLKDAILNGAFEVLEWIENNGYALKYLNDNEHRNVIILLIEFNNITMLNYLQKYDFSYDKQYFSIAINENVYIYNSLKILKWLLTSKYVFSKNILMKYFNPVQNLYLFRFYGCKKKYLKNYLDKCKKKFLKFPSMNKTIRVKMKNKYFKGYKKN